jgi:RNA recognition motif-containing protein
MNIYVGNLSFKTTEKGLLETFVPFGLVKSATIITDGYTGRSKGFGFVEMPDMAEAKAAIAGMNGKDLDLSPLVVHEAKPRGVPSNNRSRVH